MTLRIETASDGGVTVLRLIGRVESEHVGELWSSIRSHHGAVVLDLDEVSLVDRAVVCFLVRCKEEGIELVSCPRYIREWMKRERCN
jgi:ABC-type transporter Mla MlaB component